MNVKTDLSVAALYEAGWMRYGWPASVGGLGGPAMLRAVLGEEVASRDLAEPGIYSMVLVPTVIWPGSAGVNCWPSCPRSRCRWSSPCSARRARTRRCVRSPPGIRC